MINAHTEHRYWYRKENVDGDRHQDIYALMEHMKNDTDERQERYRRNLGFYSGETYYGLRAGIGKKVPKPGGSPENEQQPAKLNVIQNVIDTLSSKIATQRPKPMFVTSGGNWSDREKAKQLEKFVDAVFYECKFYYEARRAFVDAAIFGTGVIKVYSEDGKIKTERVFPQEIIVDESSAFNAEPRVMFQRKDVPATILKRRFPKFEKEIELALSQAEPVYHGEELVADDMVEVIEAWHLPSAPGAGDGRHVMCISGADLVDEVWTSDFFPFCILRWTTMPVGWYGQSIVDQLGSLQDELDKLLGRIQRAMHLHATTITFIEKGSIKKQSLLNKVGIVVEYETGTPPPTHYTPTPMSSQVFEHVWSLYARMFEQSGVSQLSATSRKPTGVESGVALRTLLDTETQRFGMLVRDWEEFAIDVARLVVRIARKDGTKRVHWVDRDWMEPIDFKELKDLDEDAYVLKVYPTNLLPTTPAGRLATVQELMQMEIIADPRQAMALLDFPDLQRFADLQTAAMDSIDKSIELILERGRWVDPVPYMDKQLAQQRVQSALLHGQVHDCPPDRLEMLEEWLEKLLNPDLPALPPPPMPGGPEMMEMAPQGPPMTPGGPVLPPA